MFSVKLGSTFLFTLSVSKYINIAAPYQACGENSVKEILAIQMLNQVMVNTDMSHLSTITPVLKVQEAVQVLQTEKLVL